MTGKALSSIIPPRAIQILDQALSKATPLSILELQGLGKEVWAGVNADEYLRRERQAWE